MENLEFYSFISAKLFPFYGEIIPSPIYILIVNGETRSLDAKIHLMDTEKVENGYKVFKVVGEDGPAYGSKPYQKSIGVYPPKNCIGVLVKGLDKSIAIPFADVEKNLVDSTVVEKN